MRATPTVLLFSILLVTNACGGTAPPGDAGADASDDGALAPNELVCIAYTTAPDGGVGHAAACTDYEGPSSPAACSYGVRAARCPEGAVARCDYAPGADGTTLFMLSYPPTDLGAVRSLCTGTFTELQP